MMVRSCIKKIKQARRYNGRRYNCAILAKWWSGSETQHQDQSYNKEFDHQHTTRRKENFSAHDSDNLIVHISTTSCPHKSN